MNRAIFLDRDGVINENFGYVHKIEDFIFIDGIFNIARKAKTKIHISHHYKSSWYCKGYYSETDFHRLTKWMVENSK